MKLAYEREPTEEPCGQVVPAAVGTYHLCYCRDGSDIGAMRVPVIAWGISTRGFVTPISASGTFSSSSRAPIILHPDGLVEEYDAVWSSYEEWLADLKQEVLSNYVLRQTEKLRAQRQK